MTQINPLIENQEEPPLPQYLISTSNKPGATLPQVHIYRVISYNQSWGYFCHDLLGNVVGYRQTTDSTHPSLESAQETAQELTNAYIIYSLDLDAISYFLHGEGFDLPNWQIENLLRYIVVAHRNLHFLPADEIADLIIDTIHDIE